MPIDGVYYLSTQYWATELLSRPIFYVSGLLFLLGRTDMLSRSFYIVGRTDKVSLPSNVVLGHVLLSLFYV